MTDFTMTYERIILVANNAKREELEYSSKGTYERLQELEYEKNMAPQDTALQKEYDEQLAIVERMLNNAIDKLSEKTEDGQIQNNLTDQKIDINTAKSTEKLNEALRELLKIANQLNGKN